MVLEHTGRKWSNPSVRKLLLESGKSANDNAVGLIKDRARELVLRAFEEGWVGPPFDMIFLARMLNIEVTPNEMVLEASIQSKADSGFLIEYNPFQNPSRINFSLAHEIGHTLFSDCAETTRYRGKEEPSAWELEFLCNVAAAEILLPYAVFEKDANETQLSLRSLMDLANKYQASLESVFIRFCEVVDKPCLCVLAAFSEDGFLEVQYTVKSGQCELDIPEGYVIPVGSTAYDCQKSGWTSHELESWPIFVGKKCRVFAVGFPSFKKQHQVRVGLFIVPEIFDAVSKEAIYIVQGDATEPRAFGKKIIAQVVNSSAGVGFGFGRAMASKYPKSKEDLHQWKQRGIDFELGNSQLVELEKEGLFVLQMFAQKGMLPKQGETPLSYSSLRKCLISLREHALEIEASVHMPMIGAGQAKGDWSVIQGMIQEELVNYGVGVTVYVLPRSNQEKKQNKIITLFD